jgi:hypothetical protein
MKIYLGIAPKTHIVYTGTNTEALRGNIWLHRIVIYRCIERIAQFDIITNRCIKTYGAQSIPPLKVAFRIIHIDISLNTIFIEVSIKR